MDKTYRWVKMMELEEAKALLKEGQAISFKIEQHTVCLSLWQGHFRAIKDRCPHAGASLGEGWCDEQGMVVCPLHRIKFDPNNGKNVSGEGYYLPTYPLDERADGLYIGFEIKQAWWKWW
ncbi:MAG: Rieske 2Fe-2S domain-containing protein [Chitinophagales bacterium]|nr:Rieske 2Fe-2S domain-containing protein [Chitinophagales bacterium]